MTRKALLLFIAASVIWGSSFLFIRLAVEHMPPATVVFGRTLLGAAFLVPLAASRRARRSSYATDVLVDQEFEMTSQPTPPLLAGHVLEIGFETFTPQITADSDRQLTVEIAPHISRRIEA